MINYAGFDPDDPDSAKKRLIDALSGGGGGAAPQPGGAPPSAGIPMFIPPAAGDAPAAQSAPSSPVFRPSGDVPPYGGSGTAPNDSFDPSQRIANTGINGAALEKTPRVDLGDQSAASPAAASSGLDPSNPIDAVFLKTGYGDRGIGSGFGDLSYWRQHPDQAQRLLADQQGHGHDTPGPKDQGNTSDGSNAAMLGAGRSGGSLSGFLFGSGDNNDPTAAISQAIGQYANQGNYLSQLLGALRGRP